jgi:hypothetical protein
MRTGPLPPEVERRQTLPHGRALAYGRLVAFGLLIGLLVAVLALSVPVGFEVIGLLGAVLAAVLLIFCISPLFTAHQVMRSRLILRQGWYFRAVLPFEDVVSVESAETLASHRVPLGIHRPLGRPILYVTAGRTGLVRVTLVRPRRFLQAFGLAASEVVFDVADVRAFFEAYEQRRQLLAPVEADRPDA